MWRRVLEIRYENVKKKVLIGDSSVIGSKDSIWWRDVLLSDNYIALLFHNFTGAISCKLGNVQHIPFWYGCWAADQNLMNAFLEIYAATTNDSVTVADAGSYSSDGWYWSLAAIADITNSNFKQALWLELLQNLQLCLPFEAAADCFGWRPNPSNVFAVSSCYSWLLSKLSWPPLNDVS